MKLFVNGEEIPDSIAETELGPLLDRLLQERQSLGLHILALRVNDMELALESDETFKVVLNLEDRIEVDFAPIEALIARNIENAGEYLDRLLPGFEKAANLFRMGSEQEANQFFLEIIDGIEWFSEVVDSIIEATGQDPSLMILGKESLQDRKERLLGFTTQMVEANQNRDWVLLADLLEYELTPFYAEWQSLLPKLLPPNQPN